MQLSRIDCVIGDAREKYTHWLTSSKEQKKLEKTGFDSLYHLIDDK